MIKFLKQWMLLFALVVISSCVIPSVINQEWTITIFIFQLLLITCIMCIVNFAVEKLSIELPIIKHLVRMCIVLTIVYLFGWLWRWYTLDYWWIILAMVVPVYVIFYFIETVKVERDVDWINKQIQSRKQKKQGEGL